MFEKRYYNQVRYWRLLGLSIILIGFFYVLKKSASNQILFENGSIYSWDTNQTSICIPFHFKMVDSRQRLSLPLRNGQSVDVPIFSTHKLQQGRVHPKVTSVILVQHGNLRNGRDYFCTNLHALTAKTKDVESFLIIAPQFLSTGDFCWNEKTSNRSTIDFQNPDSWCGFQVFSSEGWKDGLTSVNTNTSTATPFYSYDLYNLLIELLHDQQTFPNIRNITLFGFSAGAQVLLRYATLPRYEITARMSPTFSFTYPLPIVRYVISDPSSYIYFDKRRPYPRNTLLEKYPTHTLKQYNDVDENIPFKSSVSFGYPNASWNVWKIDSNGLEWIPDWDTTCQKFNQYRYGLEELTGYFKYHASKMPSPADFVKKVISDFEKQNIIYLAGTNDTQNCRLWNYAGCIDHSIESHCRAMLQGGNRLDRIIKWKAYLNLLYGREDVHSLVFADGIPHDQREMVASQAGGCVIYGLCNSNINI